MRGTATKAWYAAALAAACVVAGLAADATAADDESPPVGLERLKGKEDGKLPLGQGEPPQPSAAEPPAGAKGLGAGPEKDSYSPGRPGGDRSSDPDTIGGGTRLRKGSELDDIR
jgi:hypothetical protein